MTRKIQITFGLAILLLLIAGVVSYHNVILSGENDRRVRHTHEVIETLQNLVSDMEAIESSDRGFVLTGEKSYLDSNSAGVSRARENEARVRNLTLDNPRQQQQLPGLEDLVAKKINLAESFISIRRSNGLNAASEAIIAGHGQRIMSEIQAVVRGMQNEELRLLVLRNGDVKQHIALTKSILILGVFLGLLMIVGAAWSAASELARAFRETNDSEAKYRGLLEAAPDAIVVVNADGEIVLLNLQAEKKLGYRRDELIGQQVKNIIPHGFAERLIADGTRNAAEALAQQIGTGIELSCRRKDRSEFPIEIMLSPLESAGGTLVTAAIRDISIRKEAEAQLLQITRELTLKHQLLDAVVEGTTDPIYVRDLESRFVLANSACSSLFGLRVDQVVGINLKELLPANYLPIVQSDEETVRNGGFRTVEEIAEIDGIPRTFLTTKGPYRDADQNILGTLGIARDITERKKSEEHLVETVAELKRSNDDLGQFAYVASHDLQEPLRMVASYTQLLAKRYKGRLDTDADEFIDFAVDGCNRMQALIRDLLAYSRAGAHTGTPHTISGEEALVGALTNLRATIDKSGAIVTHDSLPSIRTDGMQLTQVFQNLVGNAIKYRSAETPHINVSALRNASSEWVFSVRDNGLGIDAQYFDRIFVLFQRLHGREEFEGTGIGLAICKKIIERQGGKMWVESQLGAGSIFYFTLPEKGGK